MKVKTRIAPSPTGTQMHIGNFRTALFSYLWARKNNGEFIMRIEDTDRKRYVSKTTESYLELFNNFNIKLNEYPTPQQVEKMQEVEYPEKRWVLNMDYLEKIQDSDYTNIYVQTQRIPLYLKYAFQLLLKNYVYLCFLNETELEQLKQSLPKYQPFRSPHRFLTKEESLKMVSEGKPYVIRLNIEKYIEDKQTKILDYTDLVLGKMKFDLETVDDQVLIKSNGLPTYHFAVVIDDYLMEITHPIRGYGWLPSTPKQVILYDMLGWEMKPFAHVTDILDATGGKLSKRKGAVSPSQFVKEGYLKEAIINFIVLLGWTPRIERKYGEKEREIFSLDELVNLFDIEGISNSNPIFDRTKLLWFNKEYIKSKNDQELTEIFKTWLIETQDVHSIYHQHILKDDKLILKISLVKERSSTLVEIINNIHFFYYKPESIDWEIPQLENIKKIKNNILEDLKNIFTSFNQDTAKWTHEVWEKAMRELGDKYKAKHGDIFMVLRVAVTGKPYSPPLFEALQILGKDEVLSRIN